MLKILFCKDLLEGGLQSDRPGNAPSSRVRSVQEVIGTALDKIGTYNDLDNKLNFQL